MKRILLPFAAVSLIISIMMCLVAFVWANLMFLAILPYRFWEGDYEYDHGPVTGTYGGRKRGLWERIKAIYKYELRADPVYMSLYEMYHDERPSRK